MFCVSTPFLLIPPCFQLTGINDYHLVPIALLRRGRDRTKRVVRRGFLSPAPDLVVVVVVVVVVAYNI